MSRTSVVIPIRSLQGGKSRLGEIFDANLRQQLVVRMAMHVINQVTESGIADRISVITSDPLLERCLACSGVQFLLQPVSVRGLNPAISFGRDSMLADGFERLLVVFADLPEIAASELQAIDQSPAAVTIIPDRQRQGTNALQLSGRDVMQRFAFHYGPDSYADHVEEAASLAVSIESLELPGMSIDLDTPDDWSILSPGTQARLLNDERPLTTSQTARAVLMEHA